MTLSIEVLLAITEDITLVESAALRPGGLIAGKYLVSRFVGAGGMAQVFEAVNKDLDERVALKLMHPAFRADGSLTEKFRAEARSAARIRSEFVARVFDVISTDEGDPVIVMEFLDGADLRSWVNAHGRPSLEVAVGWMIEACAGLAVAHANSIVHRDVKPENLFIAQEMGGRTQIKLLDFGISRVALTYNPARAGSGQHGALRLLGTPTYMAPEQITSSRAADPRMDVWSVGVLLYELLAGVPPFQGKTPEDTCLAILEGHKNNLKLLRPDVPDDLVALIDRCLAKTPEGRPPSVADVAVALHPFALAQDRSSVDRTVILLRSAGLTEAKMPSDRPSSTESVLAGAFTSEAPRASNGPTSVNAPVAEPTPSKKSSSKLWVALLALALVAVVGGLYFFFFGRAPSQEEATAATKPAVANVEVVTDPSEAAIEIDGVAYGKAPRSVALAIGKHQMIVRLADHADVVRVLEVTPEMDQSKLTVALTPLPTKEPAPTPTEVARGSSPSTPAVTSKRNPSGGRGRPSAPQVTTPSAPTTVAPTSRPTVQIIPDGPSKVKVIE